MHGQSGQQGKHGDGPPRIRSSTDQRPATDCIAGSGRASPVPCAGAKLIGFFRRGASGGGAAGGGAGRRRKQRVWTVDCLERGAREATTRGTDCGLRGNGASDLARNHSGRHGDGKEGRPRIGHGPHAESGGGAKTNAGIISRSTGVNFLPPLAPQFHKDYLYCTFFRPAGGQFLREHNVSRTTKRWAGGGF